jgi:RimJ/RimL family protein N-acetyltransferase
MNALSTPRLLLRPWQDSDREPFAQMNADPRVMEFLIGPLSREESDRLVDHIQAHFQQHGFGLFAAELREASSRTTEPDSPKTSPRPRLSSASSAVSFIGFIGLAVPAFEAHFTPCVEIGWRLAPAHWGCGLATEGARAVLRYAFETLALEEVVSLTVPANLASRRVMEKVGMTHSPADDFDHPLLPPGHPLRRHVLYRLRRAAWKELR